jgi:hypothetical protein
MAFSQTDIDAIKAALAANAAQGGAQIVRFADGRQVQYRSVAEMREILALAQADVAASAATPPARMRRVVFVRD